MLLKAIGQICVLYFFDQIHNRYIEFKPESENTYHGFHLDTIDEKRVPEEIKMIIKELMSRFLKNCYSLFSIKNSTFVLIN